MSHSSEWSKPVLVAPPDPLDHTVYVLSQVGRSLFERPTQGKRTYYTGVTKDLQKRVIKHNNGEVAATKGIEWEPVAWLPGFTRKQAYHVEKFLKRGATIEKRAEFYVFCELSKSDDTAAQQYYQRIYPKIYRFLKKGYETP